VSKIELDDQILNHPKFVLLIRQHGPGAFLFWMGLRAYCSQHLTDGLIPTEMLSEVRGACARGASLRRRVDALVTHRLLHRVDAGVVLHDYLDHAQSRAQVLAWRAANAARKAKSREVSRRDSQRDLTTCHGVTHSVTDAVTPRGVPAPSASASASALRSPSEIPPKPPQGGKPKPPRTRQPPRALTEPPDALDPTPATLAVASRAGRDWQADWARCRDWARSKGERRADWQATLRNWMTSPINGNGSNTSKPIQSAPTNRIVFRLGDVENEATNL